MLRSFWSRDGGGSGVSFWLDEGVLQRDRDKSDSMDVAGERGRVTSVENPVGQRKGHGACPAEVGCGSVRQGAPSPVSVPGPPHGLTLMFLNA